MNRIKNGSSDSYNIKISKRRRPEAPDIETGGVDIGSSAEEDAKMKPAGKVLLEIQNLVKPKRDRPKRDRIKRPHNRL